MPTERKTWGRLAARHASIAMPTVPSVEFLKPVGMESADVSSRCTCDSVVRAPIAAQEGTVREVSKVWGVYGGRG